MAISLTHTTVAVGTDAGNGEIAKAQWNENHTLTMSGGGKVLGRATAGDGAVEELSEITLASGTKTASAPVLDMSQTWNNAAVTFTGLKLNVTDTTSASGSLLMDLQVGGATKARISKAGTFAVIGASSNDVLSIGGSGRDIAYSSNALGQHYVLTGDSTGSGGPAQLKFGSGATITWQSTTRSDSGSTDLIVRRRGAANLALGAADAAAPVAQTLSVQSVVAGTTNTAGANLTITGSQGTGTGAGGSIIFQVAPAGSSGSAQNALATALTIASTGAVSIGTTFTLLPASAIFSDWNGYFGWSGGTQIRHNSSTEALRIVFGGTEMIEIGGATSSFPALKRNSTALETKLADDSAYAPHAMQYLDITDGITAPSAGTGRARIYVDTADGDLKVIFADGTVKTIVVDT